MPAAKVVRIKGPGGPEVLSIEAAEVRDPGPGELLVRVVAAGLNRADVLQRRGLYPAPAGVAPDVPGLEYVGHVATCGAGVTGFAVGDAVMGIVGGGAMATYLVVHEREALPVPAGMDLLSAAAIPEAFLTAFDALFVQGEVAAGEDVLVNAVGSGVGTAAIQLLRWAGARAIGTSRTQEKLTRCSALGMSSGVLANEGRFSDGVRAATQGRGVALALDLLGGGVFDETFASLAQNGRWICVGLLSGGKGTLDLSRFLAKRIVLRGTVLRSRPLEEKAALAQRFRQVVLPAFASQTLEPVVDAVMPMTDIAGAHRRLEASDTFGKLVLAWDA